MRAARCVGTGTASLALGEDTAACPTPGIARACLPASPSTPGQQHAGPSCRPVLPDGEQPCAWATLPPLLFLPYLMMFAFPVWNSKINAENGYCQACSLVRRAGGRMTRWGLAPGQLPGAGAEFGPLWSGGSPSMKSPYT